MKSCTICANTIDQCVHTSIAPCHALAQPCYVLPCLEPNVLRLAKPLLRVTMMPLGASSISRDGSLVRPDAQNVALRLRLSHTMAPKKFSLPAAAKRHFSFCTLKTGL